MGSEPLSVCLLVSSLEFGGAERQAVEMVRTFDRRRIQPLIISLSSMNPLAETLPDCARDLQVVRKRGRFDVTTVFRVASVLRRHRADVVHAFLFDAEIVARLAAPLAGVRVVVASERNADYARPMLHRVALRLTRPLFDVMVANSHAGKRFNVGTQGLDPSRIEVVHNGVDTERFYPHRQAGAAFRDRFTIDPAAPVVGLVASYKRQKGHDTFLRMAALVRRRLPATRFVIVGGLVGDAEESARYRDEVRSLADSMNLDDVCTWVDRQHDMNAIYNAFDVTALVSRREGTPNVVLESMACGVPVVVSNVADNASIVADGTNGFVVPVDDASAAATRVCALLESDDMRRGFGAEARACVAGTFSVQRAADDLERIYRDWVARRERP